MFLVQKSEEREREKETASQLSQAQRRQSRQMKQSRLHLHSNLFQNFNTVIAAVVEAAFKCRHENRMRDGIESKLSSYTYDKEIDEVVKDAV